MTCSRVTLLPNIRWRDHRPRPELDYPLAATSSTVEQVAPILLNAILSLDAYSRGCGPGGAKLGDDSGARIANLTITRKPTIHLRPTLGLMR
jgi:hypothetical protein